MRKHHCKSWNWLKYSSSISTATFVGYGLINYRWVFSAGRLLQSAVASGTSKPQLGGPVIRTFQLPPPGVPHVWNDASEPQQRKVELWARNCREFCRKWRLPCHFWALLHDVNLRHGTDGFTSPPKEGVLRNFFAGFGRVWTRELGYQRPARSPPRPPKPLDCILGCWIMIFLQLTVVPQSKETASHKVKVYPRTGNEGPEGE